MNLDRRAFLQGGAAALGGAALALGGRAAWDAAAPEPSDVVGRAVEPFRGIHQAGVSTPGQAFASWLAFDLLPGVDRAALVRLMRIWTDDIDRLTSGRGALADTEPELAEVPARLTVTLGFGPQVFTATGLERERPSWLAPLPDFAIDRLEARWSGGDVVLQVAADDELTIAHAGRVLTRGARTFLTPRWTQQGFRRSAGSEPPGTTMRNLMGQVDGTRNPEGAELDDLVWHPGTDGGWLAGGTSMVIRRIAMDLDRWDTVDRAGRDFALGRRQSDGAPLTGEAEHDVPDLAATDDLGLPVIDTAAHIRRARTEDPRQRFLRRGYNYLVPAAAGEPSSAGLVFVTFQRDVRTQFVPVQERLAELDLLNQWTTPIGSTVLAVPGGCAADEHLAQRLLGS